MHNSIRLPKNYVPMHEILMYVGLFYYSLQCTFGMMGPKILDIIVVLIIHRLHGKKHSVMLGMAGSTINFSIYRGRNNNDRERTYIFSKYLAK